jgi:hypothetical protein
MNDSLKIEGNFKGKVNSFKGKGVTIQYGNNTSFKGNIVMNGLPKIEETYIELTADEIKSTKSILNQFHCHLHSESSRNSENLNHLSSKFKVVSRVLQ